MIHDHEDEHAWTPWCGHLAWCAYCGEIRAADDRGEREPLTPKAATATRDRVITRRRLERVTRRN